MRAGVDYWARVTGGLMLALRIWRPKCRLMNPAFADVRTRRMTAYVRSARRKSAPDDPHRSAAQRAVITSSKRRWLSSGPRPADSETGCILYIAAFFEDALFCRSPSVVPGAACG